MIDGPSSIDPLVAEGPLVPSETLRPLPNLQRVLILDREQPLMADLERGNVRAWENGPPISVPVVSTTFDLADYERLQIQVLRDPRPTSVDSTLFSLACGTTVIDVFETTAGQLCIGTQARVLASGPIGGSLAVVVDVETDSAQMRLTVSARNAETLDGIRTEVDTESWARTTLTIGGPTTSSTGTFGRRRLIPAYLVATRTREPVDQMRRVLDRARRAVRDRVV